jgi:hypothetical protein
VTSIGSTIAGSLSSFSPGTSVFTGLAANMPALQSAADSLSAGIPGIQSNIVTSNGSSVFTGLAANTNARAPATQTASQNQTALTKAQTRAIQTGSFKTGFNQ